MFPCCPVYFYFLGLHLDKLLEYALTEAKHRFSGKRPANVIAAAKGIDLKPGELSQNKDISMILREADICPLPETPSLPLQ